MLKTHSNPAEKGSLFSYANSDPVLRRMLAEQPDDTDDDQDQLERARLMSSPAFMEMKCRMKVRRDGVKEPIMRIHRAPKLPQFDFSMSGGGSLYLLQSNTDAAIAWLNEHVSREGFQPYWPTVVIEHRCVCDILAGLDVDRLTVEH